MKTTSPLLFSIFFVCLLLSQTMLQAQQGRDTLWETDFSDGNYDPQIFPDLQSRYQAEVKPVPGSRASMLVLHTGATVPDGPFDYGFQIKLSGKRLYDHIDVTTDVELPITGFSKRCSYINTIDLPLTGFKKGELEFTTGMNALYYFQSGDHQICRNCQDVDFHGYIQGTFHPGLDGVFMDQLSQTKPYNRQVKSTLSDTRYSIDDTRTMREAFCNACVSGILPSDPNVASLALSDCMKNAYIPVRSDYYADLAIGKVWVFGYYATVTGVETSETAWDQIETYFDLTGRELNPAQVDGKVVVAAYRSGKRVLQKIEK